MADDASIALGAPQIAGTLVNPKGLTKKMTAATAGGEIGGAVGSLAASVIAGKDSDGAADLPNFGRVGYVAASGSEIALVKTKTGAFKMKVSDEVLARAPRGDIRSIELDQGKLLSHLTNCVRERRPLAIRHPQAGQEDRPGARARAGRQPRVRISP
jgi:hypothetical protein